MRRTIRTLSIVLVIVGLVFAAVGCQGGGGEEEEEAQVFKLGVLGPFSGPSARTGEEFKGAVQMAFEEIDYTIGDYTVELVWIDSQSDPAKATQAYEQAIVDDGIDAAIINWHSSVSVACMEIAAKHQIPHISAFGATETVNETWQSDPDKYFYWVNKWWPSPASLSVRYVEAIEYYINEGVYSPEEKTVVIYGEDTDWGRSFGEGISAQFEEAGWEVLAEEYFPLEQTEFTPLLNRFNELNPAVIAGTSTSVPNISAFINQADEVGLEGLIIADGLGWVGDWYSNVGDSGDGVMDQISVTSFTTEEGQAFAESFEEEYGMEPSPSSGGLAFDAANFFIAAAQQVYENEGELSSETIANFARDEIQTGNWSFTGGIIMEEYKYTPETVPDPVVGDGYYAFPVIQYFGGEGTIIYPTDMAEQELQVP